MSIPEERFELEVSGQHRRFRLVQQSLVAAARFLQALDSLVRFERRAKSDGRSLREATEAVALQSEQILAEILIPVDGLPPLTAEEASGLVLDQRVELLEAQQRLNRFDEVLPSVLSHYIDLLQIRAVRAMVVAE